MDCPKCKSRHYAKDVKADGRQRYKCKGCHFRYTVIRKSDVKTPEIKRLSLEMYLEGLGFRRIGRILQISYGTVFAWVKKWSLTMFVPRREGRVRKVELEKLIAYAESRKGTRYGLLLIDLKDNVSLLSLDKPAGRDKVQA